MKKYILLFLLILFVIPVVFFLQYRTTSSIYKTLYFSGDKFDENANKILYDYVLKANNMTPKEIEELANIIPESVFAFEVDLNDDGTNEIIGLVNSTFYWGTAGFNMFILQKHPDGYKDISYILNFEPQKNVYIFNTKTKGYRDIKIYGSFGLNGKPFIVKYINGYYQNDYQIKSLERALRQ